MVSDRFRRADGELPNRRSLASAAACLRVAGFPMREPESRHYPDVAGHPDLYVVGDYLFDSTLNGVLDSAVLWNTKDLGYLTIQTTEPNEATGVLDGPAVDKVHTGDQVKTQLQ